ncbi:(2E,6E)-farnesyl diphosphate synthase [Candidatus Palibaumannia cicadellinicola]|nr:(2E,6E)-farnesyl diphosphate synthase [Candidatus Baumannia cicadellinicola]MBS0032717.1 (2E,6E)-farnesyl diphosphate synthase [Candidatus Baumannia cicadellinicola]MCJ7462292.1 (2E,6E)-farnesyl diphosphate synthase [Candidatus Baumannia cicadellinicola]MCJ7462812.1 (2E,6E)-farnesyl diphosphate synthase [Candidatus Baumannia cicadellinicola]
MRDLISKLQKSSNYIEIVLEQHLCTLSSKNKILVTAMRSALTGGKRLRPFLIYQTGKLFGIKKHSLNAAAAAIECIHAYSLIHDDLPAMDNHKLRRGKPTCHIQFGEKIAILAGDALHTLAFTILANAQMPAIPIKVRLKMIEILANASGANGMCLGQALELESQFKKMSAKAVETIYSYKTGALIRAAVHIGAIAAGNKSKLAINYLDRYATAIGLAFQVQDDLWDISEDNQNTGQPDLEKTTYLSQLGLDMARARVIALYRESLASLEYIKAIGYNPNILMKLARYIIEHHNITP